MEKAWNRWGFVRDQPWRLTMTILNFHGLGPLPRELDEGEYSCWLDRHHFEVILDHIQGKDGIMITFDDGNESDFHIALPALLKRGMTAVFFICSGRIGGPGFLSASQCRELVSNEMKIGSHGVDHAPCRTLGRTALEREVKDSRRVLEKICGKSVDMAACPFGSYDRRVLGTLKNAGYRAVFTSDGGRRQKRNVCEQGQPSSAPSRLNTSTGCC